MSEISKIFSQEAYDKWLEERIPFMKDIPELHGWYEILKDNPRQYTKMVKQMRWCGIDADRLIDFKKWCAELGGENQPASVP